MRTAAFLFLFGSTALAQAPAANYDEAKVPDYTLPPLLIMNDGTPVRGAADWEKRRAEIRALLESQRPRGLKKLELEQYNVMLEEQAFPFEEKAIELHEANARRTVNGIYDRWVKSSYRALARLRPVQFGKSEVTEGAIDAIR